MDFGLQGKRALVTGASGGIGGAIAEALAGVGVKVLLQGRNRERTEQQVEKINGRGGDAASAIGDLSDAEGVMEVVSAATASLGGIDILVNNAGGPTGSTSMTWFDNSPDDWIENYVVNTVSAVRLAHALAPAMVAQGWGRIIQISSGTSVNTRVYTPGYSAAKAGMNNMTSSLSKALANTGVTVNGIVPGLTLTPALEDWLRKVAEQNNLSGIEDAEKFVLKNNVHQTVSRIGVPVDVAWAVLYLASPNSDFVNGAILRVEGGSNPVVNN